MDTDASNIIHRIFFFTKTLPSNKFQLNIYHV